MRAVGVFLYACAVFAVLSCAVPVHAVIVLNEAFNNDDAFAKTDVNTSSSLSDGSSDYWGIHDPTGTTDDFGDGPDATAAGVPVYSGFTGNFLIAEDIDAHPDNDDDDPPFRLTWNNLPVTGLTDFMFSGRFAAQTAAEFESSDFVKIQYRFNSDVDAFTELFWFSADGDIGGNNDELALDNNFDGTVDGAPLSETSAVFTKAISGTGTTLDIRIEMVSSDSNEAFAFDDIMVSAVPEPTAFLFGGLVCGVIGLGFARKKLFAKASPASAAAAV